MSQGNPYQPPEGTAAAKVVDYFRANPDEELTRSDIADKFEIPAASIDNCLRKALDAGLLRTKNNAEMVRCWAAGPNLARAPAKKPRAERQPAPPFDPAALVIEQDIPKPAAKSGRTGQYVPVVERLGVGSSVLLPHVHAKGVMDMARKLARQAGSSEKYSLRKIDDTNSRVWRDA